MGETPPRLLPPCTPCRGEMPILEQMYQVLYNGKRCEDAVRELFQRGLKKENG